MGKVLMCGTSGGVASDDITAKREDIIAGKTAITADSDDEIVEGTLPEHKITVDAVAVGMASNGTHYNMHCPKGAYRRTDLGEGGGAGIITTPLTELRRTIGYTNPAKVLNDTTIAGQTGTIPIQGGSTIVPGTGNKTAIGAGRYASGNIIVSGDPNLNAANIKKNVTIFGVRGSFEGYVTSPLYLFNNGAWSNIQTTGITHMAGNGYAEEEGGYVTVGVKGIGNYKTLGRLNSSVSLTNYTYLNVYAYVSVNISGNICRIGVSQNAGLTTPNFTSHVDITPRNITSGIYKIPISSLSGNYFIYLSIINGSSGNSDYEHLKLSQIFLSNT